MSRGQDPQVTIERLRSDQRDMRREVGRFCDQVDELEGQLGATHRAELGLRELVRWMLKDQNIPDLTLQVQPGSAVDLEMVRRLVDVLGTEASGPAEYAAEAAEWVPLTERFRQTLAASDSDAVQVATATVTGV